LNQERRAHQDDHDGREQKGDYGFNEREAGRPSGYESAIYQTADKYEVAEYDGAPSLRGVSVTTIWYKTGLTALTLDPRRYAKPSTVVVSEVSPTESESNGVASKESNRSLASTTIFDCAAAYRS
jgi:hypothetical protein